MAGGSPCSSSRSTSASDYLAFLLVSTADGSPTFTELLENRWETNTANVGDTQDENFDRRRSGTSRMGWKPAKPGSRHADKDQASLTQRRELTIIDTSIW